MFCFLMFSILMSYENILLYAVEARFFGTTQNEIACVPDCQGRPGIAAD